LRRYSHEGKFRRSEIVKSPFTCRRMVSAGKTRMRMGTCELKTARDMAGGSEIET
jgi:hypothetical protein